MNVESEIQNRVEPEASLVREASGLRHLQRRFWNARKSTVSRESSSALKRRSSGRSPDASRINRCHFDFARTRKSAPVL